jgi:hypothetical protein
MVAFLLKIDRKQLDAKRLPKHLCILEVWALRKGSWGLSGSRIQTRRQSGLDKHALVVDKIDPLAGGRAHFRKEARQPRNVG